MAKKRKGARANEALSGESEAELQVVDGATHARFRIFPDGGVSRLRLYGTLAN